MNISNYETIVKEPKTITRTDFTSSIDTTISIYTFRSSDSTEIFCSIISSQDEKNKTKNSFSSNPVHSDNKIIKSNERNRSTESDGYFMLCFIS